jgi:uncharacterized protein (DUF486 family)
MIATLYAAGAGIIAGASFYLAWWHTDACKFLAGAFFMSSVILFYHYLADVPVPLLGTDVVLTPQMNAIRSGIQFILFLIFGYFGFIRRPAVRRTPTVARSSVVLPPPHIAPRRDGPRQRRSRLAAPRL